MRKSKIFSQLIHTHAPFFQRYHLLLGDVGRRAEASLLLHHDSESLIYMSLLIHPEFNNSLLNLFLFSFYFELKLFSKIFF